MEVIILFNTSLNKENYYKMVSLVPDIILISNFEGCAKYVNPAFEKILGYSMSELKEHTLLDIIHPKDKVLLESLVKEARKNKHETLRFEFRFKCKDGAYKWISWNINIQWDERLVYSTGRETTERKKAEQDLKRVTEKFNEAQKFAKVGHWECNAETEEYMWSDEIFNMLGYKPQEFTPTFQLFLSMVHPDDRHLLANPPLSITPANNERESDFRMIRADKEIIWVYEKIIYDFDDEGRPVERSGITQDITERKIREAKLKESENRYKNLVENVPVGIINFDTKGNIIFLNSKIQEIAASPSEEATKSINMLTDPVLLEYGISELYRECIEQRELITAEKEICTHWGKSITMRIQAAPIKDESDNVQSVIAIYEDFTERKKLVAELQAAKEKADESNKAKSQFLANMSHEIRTPMNGIMGMTNLLLLSKLTEEQTEMAEIIKFSSNSLLNIINDILDLSKINAGKVELTSEVVNFYDLIHSRKKFYKALAQHNGLDFELKIGADLPKEVIVDKIKLAQIGNNLVGNAVKFTEKGKITTSIEKVASIGNKVLLKHSVSDTGIGIKEDDIPKLFNYFTQLDDFLTKRFQGTGLGLAISKSLVELMGGEIWVESQYGKGSTFYYTYLVDIPEKQQHFLDDKGNLEYDNINNNLCILLVEDDSTAQLFIKKACKLKGWQVHAVSSGDESLEALRKNHYNLVLMDIQMSEMSGYDVAKVIRENEKATGEHIPIIAATAYAMSEDIERCLEAGMDDYIAKPIDIRSLHKVIEKWVLMGTL